MQTFRLSFYHSPFSLFLPCSPSSLLSLSLFLSQRNIPACWRPYGQILWRWDACLAATHSRMHTHTHIPPPPQRFVYERPWWWNNFSGGSILKHINGNISVILLSHTLIHNLYINTHAHTERAHTPGAILSQFPEVIHSAWPSAEAAVCTVSACFFPEPQSLSPPLCLQRATVTIIWRLKIMQPRLRRGMKTGGSSQPAWDGSHFKDAGLHWRSVPRRVRGVWKAEMAVVWAHAKATSGRKLRKIWFFFLFPFFASSQGGWKEPEENITEYEETWWLH